MELDAALKKIVMGKPFGLTMVKGVHNSGKTIIAACRALYLKGSYCLYEDEKVLVISSEKSNINLLNKLYEQSKEAYNYDYSTLFSMLKEEPVDFFTLEELVDKYYLRYIKKRNLSPVLIGKEEKVQIIKGIVDELKIEYKRIQFIKSSSEDFIIEEIDWIKSSGFTSIDDYKKADRYGRKNDTGKGPARLIKNSKSREAIFEIMLRYNEILESKNMIDTIDKERMSLETILSDCDECYTHMVVDDAHKFTRIQLQLLMALKSKKTYSSMMLMVDHKAEVSNGAWIVKGRKQKELGFEGNIKNSYLKKKIDSSKKEKQLSYQFVEETKITKVNMEKYIFMDVRHKKSFEFTRDTDNYDEIILAQGEKSVVCGKDELRTLPVYRNIAAGEPIAMEPEMVDTFNIPLYWIKGMKDCFMLKVKGDSMIGASIDDGDYVVIRKQNNAVNRDIVAVDLEGSATLKRLWMNQKEVLLMPENEKYSPIPITDRDATILGVVVGIIKSAA